MSDWLPIRAALRQEAEQWLDHLIAHEPDPRDRAMLAAQRNTLLGKLTDKAEAAMLNQFLAQRERAAERAAPPPRRRGNGHAKVH